MDMTEPAQYFEAWRAVRNPNKHWGLAWYLAYEFCRRYYASHGIAPHVIEHENLGFYGIQLDQLPCKGNPTPQTLGRVTAGGNVANWRTGSPGDHGLKTIDMCESGVVTSKLVRRAVQHMGIPARPPVSHISCRHKRWGDSYVLCFGIATIVALRSPDMVPIWNHSYHTDRVLRDQDPKRGLSEHPGAFLFQACGGSQLILAGDGRLLTPAGPEDWWQRYMEGSCIATLALELEHRLTTAALSTNDPR